MVTGDQSLIGGYAYTNVEHLEPQYLQYWYGVECVSDQGISGGGDDVVICEWEAKPAKLVAEVSYELLFSLLSTARRGRRNRQNMNWCSWHDNVLQNEFL